MSEDQILEEEKAYFMTRDHDGDGMLNREEFLRQVSYHMYVTQSDWMPPPMCVYMCAYVYKIEWVWLECMCVCVCMYMCVRFSCL